MSKQNRVLCPSAPCDNGSYLLGIVKRDGKVSIASGLITIDSEFVKLAKLGRKPGKRFRFANDCVNKKCQHWEESKCSLIDTIIDHISPKEIPDKLPKCAIRTECRWYKQCGAKACIVCPEVITDLS